MNRLLLAGTAGLMFLGLIGGIVAYRQFVSLPVERASAANTPPKLSSTIVSSGQPRAPGSANH